jgi:multiple sugar transport system substrate-binding protein
MAALALLAALAGCGGESGASDKNVSLRMTIWSSNPAHLKLFDELIGEYRKNHPEIDEIKIDPLPSDTYLTTLTTQIAGGKAPDLAWISETAAPDFITGGALLPLDETLKATPGYAYDDLVDSALGLWRSGGKLYGYPFSNSPFGIFVNTDLLKQAGAALPADQIGAGGWTWDNAIATATTVHAKTGKAGLVVRDFDYKGWGNLATVWTGWGASTWSTDGKTCMFDRPEMVDAMTFLHKAIFTDKALPGPGTTADFFAGDAGMTVTQISRASLLQNQKFGWDLVPLPAGPKGKYSVIGQGGVGVLKKSAHPRQARDFLAFMTNPANSKKLAQFFPPPRRSLLTAETLASANPLLKAQQLQNVVIDGIANGAVKPGHTRGAEILQTARSALDPMWRPDADVKTVLTGVCSAINPLLAK